jgi:hypothetical protein
MSVTALSADPGARDWFRRSADNLAAALRRRGYDAHTRCGGAELIGVEVRAVHVIGWRYPDGHWTFVDQPARISADVDGDTGGLRWSFLDHRGEVSAPSFGSVDAIAEWITG